MRMSDREVKYYYGIDQGTDEWHNLRLGVITASVVNAIVTPAGKLSKSEKMREYACEIAAQRELNHVEDSYNGYHMQRGHFEEDLARDIYHDNYEEVYKCGFVIRDFGAFKIGCSPDGLCGTTGGIEIKSRVQKFQVKTIITGEVPDEYVNQLQTFLLVTKRDWVDYIQYSSGMPFFVKRVFPDPVRQEVIKSAVAEFEIEVQKAQEAYRANSAGLVVAERVDFVANVEDYVVIN